MCTAMAEMKERAVRCVVPQYISGASLNTLGPTWPNISSTLVVLFIYFAIIFKNVHFSNKWTIRDDEKIFKYYSYNYCAIHFRNI